MPKYIDADWLLAEANMDGAYGYVDAYQIANAPTDKVLEVVRCKDCKHYQGLAECELIGDCMGTYGFCSWGERREDDEVH